MATDDLIEQLTLLSSALRADEGLDATLGRVASLSTTLIDACDSCGASLVRDGVITTRAASDDRADRVDEIQYTQNVGPCLQAIDTGRAVRVDSFESETRWPRFIERASNEGIRASYSVPLRLDDDVVGSLNFYGADRPFGDDEEQMGNVLAALASTALRNAQTYNEMLDLVDQLNEALASRDLIGQGKGILMARHGLTADAAFDLLRRESQHRNVKLRDLAAQLAAGEIDIASPVDDERRRYR